MMMNVENGKAAIYFNNENQNCYVQYYGKAKKIDVWEIPTVERTLKFLGISFEEYNLGELLGNPKLVLEQCSGDNLYQLGYEAGKKFMEDKIEKHCELGKPVMANEQLYFFKTAQENLRDIMDDLESSFK